MAMSTKFDIAIVASSEIPTVTGSFPSDSAPSAIAITIVTSRMATSEAAPVASRTPIQPAGPNGRPRPTTAWKTMIATEVVSASCARLKTSLTARCRRTTTSAAAAPDEGRAEQGGRREDEEPDDEADLAQRDRVRLAPELQVDDIRLGQVEDERKPPPGHPGGDDGRRVETVDDREPEPDRHGDEPDVVQPDRSRPRGGLLDGPRLDLGGRGGHGVDIGRWGLER